MAKPQKSEPVLNLWRWLVSHLFGQNMAFQVLVTEKQAAALDDGSLTGISLGMLGEMVQITKITSLHLDPEKGQVMGIPFFLECFGFVNPITEMRASSIPHLHQPEKSLIDMLNSVWVPPDQKKVEVAKTMDEANREANIRQTVQKALSKGMFKSLPR